MEWAGAADGKATARGESGRAMVYGMLDDSGVGPHADKANLSTVRAVEAGGMPIVARVFRRRRGIGKRSAPGVRDRYPKGRDPPRGARLAEGQ